MPLTAPVMFELNDSARIPSHTVMMMMMFGRDTTEASNTISWNFARSSDTVTEGGGLTVHMTGLFRKMSKKKIVWSPAIAVAADMSKR